MENISVSKKFDLGTILSVTTGKVFTNDSDVIDIISFLLERDIRADELFSLKIAAQFHVLSLYPELYGVGCDVNVSNFEEKIKFLANAKKVYGEELDITPIPILTSDEAKDLEKSFDDTSDDSFNDDSTIRSENIRESKIIPFEKTFKYKVGK